MRRLKNIRKYKSKFLFSDAKKVREQNYLPKKDTKMQFKILLFSQIIRCTKKIEEQNYCSERDL